MPKKIRKKQKIKLNFNSYVLAVITAVFIMVLVLNDFGLITYFKLKNKHKALDEELQRLLAQQNDLRLEINKLQTDQDYIEQIAREKFMMVKPGERVYRVKEEKEVIEN